MITVCREVAKKLIALNNVFDNEITSNDPLLFPKYRPKKKDRIRISEQESKILFANYFLLNKIYFSIEVPTMSSHSFSGESKLSARFDLATYKANEWHEFDWIIELKAHNPKDTSIQKDLEKMLASNCNCVWFHTLKNENKATIPSILGKFRTSFETLSGQNKIESSTKLLLIFVVIEQKLLYSTEFQFAKWNKNLPKDREKLKKENVMSEIVYETV
ncbi:hypothetical protein U14_01920 [Candidatus Moduliflexus flocculans]|uniref:Uncharacterized protein n=1 Tax=Candidatus Moduliflexus flocculans TaxID=1499966 RepID=A0A0S6VXE1_9BACT|nr:hypothetical protein U14_01920 [Candidatus Moduliflexus flocculans]